MGKAMRAQVVEKRKQPFLASDHTRKAPGPHAGPYRPKVCVCVALGSRRQACISHVLA